MALTIATGFVVDDAIVVMENTTRHIEAGVPRMRAALLGAREVGFTVVSMSLSLVAVFIPFMFVGGIVGLIFREFTVTLSVAILISLVISLTTTPMMCSLLLQREDSRKPSRFALAFERGFENLRREYLRTLDWALGSSATHADRLHRDHSVDSGVGRSDTQGFLSTARHGAAAGRHSRRCHKFLSVDGEASCRRSRKSSSRIRR